MRPASRSRGRSRSSSGFRRFSMLELAIGFSLVASVLAIAVPTFVREVHASRFVEPVDGLQRIGAAAVAYGKAHPVAQGFPPSAPETPAAPPRGKCVADPPGLWDTPTWTSLEFRPAPEGAPHCYAFGFDSALGATVSTFRAQAHGDLDGDGVASTFEITGRYVEADPRGPVVDPGMFIDQEIE